MKMPFGDTGKSRLRGRVVLLACLNCVQAIAPDWPLLILWPCIKMSFASSMIRWVRPVTSARKRRRRVVARLRKLPRSPFAQFSKSVSKFRVGGVFRNRSRYDGVGSPPLLRAQTFSGCFLALIFRMMTPGSHENA